MSSPERITHVYPAFDCILNHGDRCTRGHDMCDPTRPGSNYGRGGVRIRHVLKAPDLAVQLVWSPGVDLPETRQALGHGIGCEPMATDLGWHVPAPVDAVENYGAGEWPEYGSLFDCDLYGGNCWYDGSSLNADPVFDLLIRQGLDAVWVRLAEYADELRADRKVTA